MTYILQTAKAKYYHQPVVLPKQIKRDQDSKGNQVKGLRDQRNEGKQ